MSRTSKTNNTTLLEPSEKAISSIVQRSHNVNRTDETAHSTCLVVGDFRSAVRDTVHHVPLDERTDINCAANMMLPSIKSQMCSQQVQLITCVTKRILHST